MTLAAAASSASLRSGRYLRAGAARSTLPCSTRRIMAVAVKVLVVEPMRKSVSASTGSGWSTLVTPKPLQMFATLPEDADRDAGHMVAHHRRFDPLVELAEQRIGRLVARNRRDLCPRAPHPRSESQRTGGRGNQRPSRQQHPAAHLPHSVTDDTDFGSARKRASVS